MVMVTWKRRDFTKYKTLDGKLKNMSENLFVRVLEKHRAIDLPLGLIPVHLCNVFTHCLQGAHFFAAKSARRPTQHMQKDVRNSLSA